MDEARDRVNQLIERNSKSILILFAVAVIACLLQSAGYATPGWLIMEGLSDHNTTLTFNMGIWYLVVCQNASCELGIGTMSVIESLWSQEEKKDFKNYQLMATVAVFCSIASAGLLIHYLYRMRRQMDTTYKYTAALLLPISGILALVTVGSFTDDVNTEYDIWKQTEDDYFKLRLPYSLLLLGFGGALCCLVFIGLCVQIYVQYKASHRGYDTGEECVGMTSDKQP